LNPAEEECKRRIALLFFISETKIVYRSTNIHCKAFVNHI